MQIKLNDAELRVMEVIWTEGEPTASQVSDVLQAKFDYSRTTTYTLIKRCIDKGALKRAEPGFRCSALISREQVQEHRAGELIDKLFGGSPDLLIASVLGSNRMSSAEVERLKRMINTWEEK
jgi:predicted transcriptional regulator